MKIYGDFGSGNCQKVKATAEFVGLAYDWVHVDIMKGESRTPEYLAMNPVGQIPLVVFDDGRKLAQSNAIVRYLARGSSLLPDDTFEQAKCDEWMFWEQYSHEPYVAVARYQRVYLKKPEAEPRVIERGEKALDRLEQGLTGREWLVGERLSVADIALAPYTRLAEEGGFDLAPRPAVRAWVKRCEDLLKFD